MDKVTENREEIIEKSSKTDYFNHHPEWNYG